MLDVFVESDEIEKKEFNYYLIELSYVEDEFEIVDFSLEEGNLPVLERDDREFKIKLFSSEDELLYFNSFSNPGLVFSDGLITGGVIENEEVNFNVIIPNFEESYRFEILDGVEKKVLEVYLDDLN